MIASKLGEIAALLTAVFWTASALAFESASRRIGSLTVNLLRLILGFLFLSAFCFFQRGMGLPLDAPPKAWLWLSLSGVVGFSIGDLFLFRAFVVLGSRISMLIMALVPPLTALLGWAVLGETLSPTSFIGMALTLGGIALVVLERAIDEKQIRLSHPAAGIGYALGGAAGQAVGLIFSKMGMEAYDPFPASQIRILAGIAGFAVLFVLIRGWGRLPAALKDRRALFHTSIGSFFGPFLGVSFSLMAVKHTAAGIASTIMAIVPVLIIPPAVIFMKEKVNAKEVFGAAIAVAGVAVLFL
jgi:drug/metabolite transporter (DMT)-like permease